VLKLGTGSVTQCRIHPATNLCLIQRPQYCLKLQENTCQVIKEQMGTLTL